MNNDSKGFYSGQTIQGTVNVNLIQDLFPVRNLTVGLYGREHVHFWQEGVGENNNKDVHYNKAYDIIKLETVVLEFPD